MDRRLTGWKTKCLFLAGRLTLLQSTIAVIPAYAMETAKLPRSLCDEIDQKTRRFLWGGTSNEKWVHLASWELATKPSIVGDWDCVQ